MRASLGAVAALVFFYMYLVGASILNVIAMREANTETARLGNAVSLLEREYFSIAQAVDPANALRLGLTPISSTVYIHRPGTLSAGAPAEADTPAALSGSNEI